MEAPETIREMPALRCGDCNGREIGALRELMPSRSVPAVALAGGNLVQFGVMIERAAGKPALQYNDYGCYCGVGDARWPVDETDW